MALVRMLMVVLVVLTLGVAAGCASSRSGKVYSRDQARQVQTVETGTVVQVETVKIEGTQGVVGGVAGGVLGGVAGSGVGAGTGRGLATVGGAIVGAGAGALAEKKVTEKKGLEIQVKLDSGAQIAIVQEADEPFAPGDKVRVIRGGDGTARVRH